MLNYRRTLRTIFFFFDSTGTKKVCEHVCKISWENILSHFWFVGFPWNWQDAGQGMNKQPGSIGLNLFSVNYQIRPSKLEIKSKLKTVHDKSNFGIVKTVMDEELL